MWRCRGLLGAPQVLLHGLVAGSAAKQIYLHRQSPKVTNPNGPCSTILEVPTAGAQLSAVLAEAGRRLGIEAAGLAAEDGAEVLDLDQVPPQALLTVREAPPAGRAAPGAPAMAAEGAKGIKLQWAPLANAAAAAEQPAVASAAEAPLKRLFFHRQEPKRENPNGPCSTVLDVPAVGAQLPAVLADVGRLLGVRATRLSAGDGSSVLDVDGVPAAALLSVHEAEPWTEAAGESPSTTHSQGQGGVQPGVAAVAGWGKGQEPSRGPAAAELALGRRNASAGHGKPGADGQQDGAGASTESSAAPFGENAEVNRAAFKSLGREDENRSEGCRVGGGCGSPVWTSGTSNIFAE